MAEVQQVDAPRRSPTLHAVAVVAVGAVLIAVTALAVLRWTGSDDASASGWRPPVDSIALLGQPQTAGDRLPAKLANSVQLDSSRYLGTTPLGRHYVAVDLTGHLTCLVTVAPVGGDEVQAACSPKNDDRADPFLEVGSKPGAVVALLPDGAQLSSGWTSVSRNLAYSKG